MKKLVTIILILTLALACLPASSLAKAKQMNDGVPVWNEETVKDYAVKYINGMNLETLYGYYDLQVRRYLPMQTYMAFLSDIEFLTGKFLSFGTYSALEEPERQTKTHILHLCMEKQDVDLYFTHKDKADDWEVMNVEFVLAEEQEAAEGLSEDDSPLYTEREVTVGEAPFELPGVLTLPLNASADAPVPAVVLVHGSGPSDKDEATGNIHLFADIAQIFAKNGIATLRYDKRTYVYGASMTQEQIDAMTVKEETIQDAIMAGKLLASYAGIDPTKIVLVGHSMGAMLAPRIASEANGVFKAMVLIAGTPHTLLDVIYAQNEAAVAKLTAEQQEAAKPQMEALRAQFEAVGGMTADEARATTVLGVNAYYFWEMQQTDACALIKQLKIPTYIVQGGADWQVTPEMGVEAYEDILGDKLSYVDYRTYLNLNHFLMKYTGPAEAQGTTQEYETEATVDAQAALDIADWVTHMGQTDDKTGD